MEGDLAELREPLLGDVVAHLEHVSQEVDIYGAGDRVEVLHLRDALVPRQLVVDEVAWHQLVEHDRPVLAVLLTQLLQTLQPVSLLLVLALNLRLIINIVVIVHDLVGILVLGSGRVRFQV